ncbi:late blight resistance homolog R1A-10 isoform X1 [Olea europaea subsp. europaea]|uniref:Late blight resistance homolog R1A-10 isoform X1 n=1 Tax=Olea europaea subsp. europaea TaxID=158383 RepID=A0A8S0PKH7_OLEEU|nr:late blight resistance homolog R1A-10 isoform X1 [Olea europaea subsp. europaea]
MAYASLLSLAQTLEQILHPQDQSLNLHHTEQQIMRCLHEKVNFLVDFLDVISPKSSENIRDLEGRIRDAAYEAEDTIESNMSNQIVSELEQKYNGLQKVLQELASISEDLVKMKEWNDIEIVKPRNTYPSARSTNRSAVVGIRDEIECVVNKLTRSSSDLSIISVVGMPGLGKTTVARKVYKEPNIASHFDVCAWATVSQNYFEQEVLSRLLHSIRNLNHESNQESIEKLAENLYKSLKDKRYLIVLDDVWDKEIVLKVKNWLPHDCIGSRILLTNRHKNIASYVDPNCYVHQMRFLSDYESWSLLQHLVFGEERCPPELVKIGRMISRNCGGIPLPLILIGGVLYKAERTQSYWIYVEEHTNTGLSIEVLNLLSFVTFSYNQLPHHLRACFLYMGVLPEDYEIRRSKLIKLWVANRFIKPDRSKSLEEVAEDYLNDLVDRNLIMVRGWSYRGEVKTCCIHDILRDFCQTKTKEKFNSDVKNLPDVHDNLRQVSMLTELKNQIPKFDLANNRDLRVRSVTYYFHNSPHDILFVKSFQLLRILDALTIWFDKFPVEIVELETLRFIALTYWAKHRIPSSISKLRNLETLILNPGKLRSIFNTSFLPLEIWKMSRLRHLLFVRSFLPYPTDALNGGTFVSLENLQTLTNVINFRWTEEVIQMMPNLKKLVISYEHDGRTEWSSYCFDNFVHLLQLEVLKCFFLGKSYIKYQDPLPVNFAFPQKLRRLTLSGCRLSWKSMTVVGSLSKLEVLKLKYHAFEGPLWESNDGEFRRLKLLLIHMTDLEHWKVDETHFPSLERLSLQYCYDLAEIPSGIGKIPTLQKIELCECSTSVVTSAKFIEEEKTRFGNNGFQVVAL